MILIMKIILRFLDDFILNPCIKKEYTDGYWTGALEEYILMAIEPVHQGNILMAIEPVHQRIY